MNFTALQDISPQTLCWIIAGVVLLLAGFSWWRFDVAFKFKTRYNNAKQALENALIRTESTSKLLTANPVGLALQAPNFSGKTKTEYERVRLTWLNWINLRAFAHERLARAHLLFKQNQKRPWWRFFGCGKLKLAVAVLTEEQVAGACQSLPQQVLGALAAHASAQGTTASLPQVIEREEQAIVNSFAAFTKTLADADQTRREFELEFSNPVEEERAGIDGLRSNLLVAGLALSPYEERLTEITRVRDQLFKQLGEDPLTVTAQATSALKQKIGLLRRSLLDATRYKVDLEALRARHRKVSEEAGAMRKSEPVSAIAAVRFTVKHTLNEPDFEILPLLSECAGALQDLDSSLLDGHLIKFARAVEQVNQNVARCEEMFGKIIADKQLADERYAEINLLSRVADLEFDQPYHAGLSAEYAAQKWNAAANAADTLLKRCQSRAAVRKASDELDEHLSALAKRIRWHAAVVSQSLEDRLGEVEAEAALCRASAFAANPSVDSLTAQIARLGESVTGAHESSLLSALEAELAVHTQVMERLTQLIERMTDVSSRVADNWGGMAAAEKLSEVQPLLAPIVAEGKTQKPDWKGLLERVGETLALVEPVRVIVYAEVNRHERLTSSIELVTSFVQSLSQSLYRRTACGVIYGAGLYCPSAGLSELVEQARTELARRSYDEAATHLRVIKEKVGRDHLECCWMLLQSMAHTTETCAVRFAHEHGYCDGAFETWADERLKLNEEGFLPFHLPELNGTAHRSGDLMIIGAPMMDLPAATDYEPAYVA